MGARFASRDGGAEVAREQVFAGSEKWGLRVGDNGLGGTDFAWSDGNLYLMGSFWMMKVGWLRVKCFGAPCRLPCSAAALRSGIRSTPPSLSGIRYAHLCSCYASGRARWFYSETAFPHSTIIIRQLSIPLVRPCRCGQRSLSQQNGTVFFRVL